jgi:hypothetical protein
LREPTVVILGAAHVGVARQHQAAARRHLVQQAAYLLAAQRGTFCIGLQVAACPWVGAWTGR